MSADEKTGLLGRCPVVPVVVLDDAARAGPRGAARLAGGIDGVEITRRTAARRLLTPSLA